MIISSPVFKNNSAIPSKYTCDGLNVNPPLEIDDIPKETKSLVLIMDDPDAPGGTWIHWVLWNIDPKTRTIDENSAPLGAIQGKTNRKNSYGGPCPPNGIHRYFFKLYALDCVLDLDEQTGASELMNIIKKNTIEKAEIFGLYKRR